MKMQLSLEIIISLFVALGIAGIGYSAYLHAFAVSRLTESGISNYAQLSSQYLQAISSACGCS